MDSARTARLISAGVDVEDALERFMGNEAILERFLRKFLDDPNYGLLLQAIEAQDWPGALTASHTLKGICGNLSFCRLLPLLTRQVEALRAGRQELAAGLMEEITAAYQDAAAAIRQLS